MSRALQLLLAAGFVKSYMAPANDEQGDGAGGGGGGGEDQSGALTSDELKNLRTLIAGGGGEEQSSYDKLKGKEEAAKERQQLAKQIKENVIFDSRFNEFINNNKVLFSLTPEKMRSASTGLDGQDLTDELSKIAAKDFFSKEENITFLDKEDQETLKTKILGQHDKFIDASEAWALVKSAINVAAKTKRHSDFRGGGGAGVETPNIDKYLQKIKDQGKGK